MCENYCLNMPGELDKTRRKALIVSQSAGCSSIRHVARTGPTLALTGPCRSGNGAVSASPVNGAER